MAAITMMAIIVAEDELKRGQLSGDLVARIVDTNTDERDNLD